MIDGEFYLFNIKNMTAERPLVPDGSPKHGTEEFRKAKDAINKEGWEDNAAVIIGTKEELAQRREQLEQGRETVDLRTYIHMNAVDVATSDELMKLSGRNGENDWLKIGIGVCFFLGSSDGEGNIYFKSKEGSLKKVDFKIDEIDELRGFTDKDGLKKWELSGGWRAVMKVELEKLGFSYYEHNSDGKRAFINVLGIAEKWKKERAGEEKKKGFEF